MCNKNCRNYGINQTLFIIFQPNTFIWIVAALRWFSPIDCDLVHALCRRLILPYIFCCMYCWAVGFDFQGKMKIKWMSIKVWVSVNHILKLYAKRSIQIYKCQPKRKKKKNRKFETVKTNLSSLLRAYMWMASIYNLTSFALALHNKKTHTLLLNVNCQLSPHTQCAQCVHIPRVRKRQTEREREVFCTVIYVEEWLVAHKLYNSRCVESVF